ncbi:MAG: agmatinase [Candidatus Hydrogenedentota bacterium]
MNLSFLDIPEKSFTESFVRILPCGYQSTVSYMSGTAEAPYSILKASQQVEYFSSYLEKDSSKMGFIICDPPVLDLSSVKNMMKNIYKQALKYIQTNKILCTLGGEHSISYPVVKAHQDKLKIKFDVIVIDAHLDLRDSYQGTEYSHASVSRRISENHKLCIIGARSYCKEEYQYVKKNKNRVFHLKPEKWDETALLDVLKKLNDNIYLSIDCDGFDPSVFPSTGTPVPGGLFYYQGLEIIKIIINKKNVIGLDFVELIPDRFYRGSDFTAAQLLYEIFSMIYLKTLLKI